MARVLISMPEEFLNRIKHEKIKTIIKKMIEINPDKRITIEKALNDFLKEICPNAMKGFPKIIENTQPWKLSVTTNSAS